MRVFSFLSPEREKERGCHLNEVHKKVVSHDTSEREREREWRPPTKRALKNWTAARKEEDIDDEWADERQNSLTWWANVRFSISSPCVPPSSCCLFECVCVSSLCTHKHHVSLILFLLFCLSVCVCKLFESVDSSSCQVFYCCEREIHRRCVAYKYFPSSMMIENQERKPAREPWPSEWQQKHFAHYFQWEQLVFLYLFIYLFIYLYRTIVVI